jgi:hypothetical protein
MFVNTLTENALNPVLDGCSLDTWNVPYFSYARLPTTNPTRGPQQASLLGSGVEPSGPGG